MNTDLTKGRTGSSVIELTIMACQSEVAKNKDVEAAFSKIEVLQEKLEQFAGYEPVQELEDAISILYLTYAKKMFMWGWKLRGNPDMLCELIEPE